MTTMPIYALVDTWDAAGTTFKGISLDVTDTASAAGSLLMDLQVGGSSKFQITKAGRVAAGAGYLYGNPQFYDVSIGTGLGVGISGSDVTTYINSAATFSVGSQSTGVRLAEDTSLGWTVSHAISSSPDLRLFRDAADTLAQRNGVNAQAFRLYNTFTDASNYERFGITWGSNVVALRTSAAGSGIGTRAIILGINGGSHLGIGTTAGYWNIAEAGGLTGYGHLTFGTDNTYDIGASGANRPRDLYLAGGITVGAGKGISDGAYYNIGTSTSVVLHTGLGSSIRWSSSIGNNANATNITGGAGGNNLEIRSGTSAQTLSVYNTYTDVSNHERGFMKWDTNVLRIGTEKAGTGTARALELQTDGVTRLSISATGSIGSIGYLAVQPAGYTNASILDNVGNFQTVSDGAFTFSGSATNAGSSPDVTIKRGGAAGVILLGNNLTPTDFNRLQFGGTTSSFPALKRNSTALETKLADDSAYAPHAMQYLDVTDGITAPAAATGRARIYVDTADGDLKVIFADGTIKTIVTDT